MLVYDNLTLFYRLCIHQSSNTSVPVGTDLYCASGQIVNAEKNLQWLSKREK